MNQGTQVDRYTGTQVERPVYLFTCLPVYLLPALALSALASTILLILVGSIVRVTGNGLGCPDWPLCYGQAIPPAFGGAWVEFSHRFLAAATTAQVLLLAVLAWRNHRAENWVLRPALLAVALLAAQIVLGGLHVILELPPTTGWIHTGTAMLIVGALAVLATITRSPLSPLGATASAVRGGRPFAIWISINTVALYLLLLTGSYVTRTGASLVCPSFPACGSAASGLRDLIAIQMLHRYMALAVGLMTLATVGWLLRAGEPRTRRYAITLATLLAVQVGLGIANVLLRLPMWSRALHLTVGAALWVGMVGLWTMTQLDGEM